MPIGPRLVYKSSTPSYPGTMVLLMHMDSSSFPDYKSHTVTKKGTPTYDTADYKFSTGSVKFDGSSNALLVSASSDFGIGNGAFTIEFWVKNRSAASNTVMFSIQDSASPFSNGIYVLYQGTFLSVSHSAGTVNTSGTLTGGWNHLVVSHSGASTPIRVFLNGTMVAKSVNTSPTIGSSAGVPCYVCIGAKSNNNGSTWTTYCAVSIDELRIDTTDRYPSDSSFTPPSAPY